MTMDWCPGIREACSHWRDAPMLQQNLEALEQTLDQDNDTCIERKPYLVAQLGLAVETAADSDIAGNEIEAAD